MRATQLGFSVPAGVAEAACTVLAVPAAEAARVGAPQKKRASASPSRKDVCVQKAAGRHPRAAQSRNEQREADSTKRKSKPRAGCFAALSTAQSEKSHFLELLFKRFAHSAEPCSLLKNCLQPHRMPVKKVDNRDNVQP